MGSKRCRMGCGGAGRKKEKYFFNHYLQCFPLKGWRPKRWKPIFMCVWPSSILNFLYII